MKLNIKKIETVLIISFFLLSFGLFIENEDLSVEGSRNRTNDDFIISTVWDNCPTAMLFGLIEFKGELYCGGMWLGQIYRSTNNGNDWEKCFDSPETIISGSAIFNDMLYFGTLGETPEGNVARIYRTAEGTSWQQVYYNTSINGIMAITTFNGTLFVGTQNPSKVLSSSNGIDWDEAFNEGNDSVNSMFVADDNLIIAAKEGKNKTHFYRTSDGVSWSFLSTLDSKCSNNNEGIVEFKNMYYFASTSGDIYRTKDFLNIELAYEGSQCYCIATYNNLLFTGQNINNSDEYGDGNVYYSADGTNWYLAYDSPEMKLCTFVYYSVDGALYFSGGSAWNGPHGTIYKLTIERSTNIHVSGSGSDTYGNGMLINPYRTISKGLEVALNGDTIIIMNGAYSEDISITKSVSFISDGGNIYLNGNITVENGGSLDINEMNIIFNCISDGQFSFINNGILNLFDSSLSTIDNENGFIFMLNSDTVIDNCYIRNLWQNQQASWWARRGLEIYDDDVLINNCEIGWDQRNLSDGIGTGIFIQNAAPHILDTTVEHADRIGIFIDNSTGPVIENCILRNGFQGLYGHRDSSFIAKNNQFINLSADAITCEFNVDAYIQDSVFIDCYTNRFFQLISGEVEIVNMTVLGRRDDTNLPEILVGDNCHVTSTNCNFGWDNISIGDVDAKLTIRNLLGIYVQNCNGADLSDVDTKVQDNKAVIYSTEAYGGTDPKTDIRGMIEEIPVTDRVYINSNIPVENITQIYLRYSENEISKLDVNMSMSHEEVFILESEVDLNVTSDDITFSNVKPMIGESILVKATVHNRPIANIERFEDELLRTQYNESRPKLSPFGTEIAYVSDESGSEELWILNLDDGSRYQITNIFYDLGMKQINGHTWSHDGNDIYFAPGDAPSFNIYGIKRNGGNLHFIVDYDLRDGGPVASPDGQYIYFTSDPNSTKNYKIVRMDIDGSNAEVIKNNDEKIDNCLSISDDGKYLLSTFDEFQSDYFGQSDIIKMSNDGSETISLFKRSGTESYNMPDFAPGRKIAFCLRPDAQDNFDIYISDSDGSNMEELISSNGEDRYPHVSNDNTKMVFDTNRNGNWDLYFLNMGSSYPPTDASARVSIYDGDPNDQGELIGYQNISVPYNSSSVASVVWRSQVVGVNTIYVSIDEVVPDDVNLSNNIASKSINVTFKVDSNVDLYLGYEDITFSKNDTMLGDSVIVSAVVHSGPIPDNELTEIDTYPTSIAMARVLFYDGDPLYKSEFIGSQNITVYQNSTTIASVVWKPLTAGDHNIYISIENVIPNDLNLLNNIAHKNISVSLPSLILIPDRNYYYPGEEVVVDALYTGLQVEIKFSVFNEKGQVIFEKTMNTTDGKPVTDDTSPVYGLDYQQAEFRFVLPNNTGSISYIIQAHIGVHDIYENVTIQVRSPPAQKSKGGRVSVPMLYIGSSVAIVTSILIGGALVTEAGKWKLLLLFGPLLSRISHDELMTQEVRGSIYGVVISEPGINFSKIKKILSLHNGDTAYHLHVLIKENKIISRREGAKRRFYPKGNGKFQKLPRGFRGPRPKGIQNKILASIEEYPGQSQKEITKKLNQSQQIISYHLKKLKKMGYVDIVKGKVNRYIIHGGPTAFSCPKCHTQFTSDTPPKFCPGCGFDLTEVEDK